MIEKVLCKLSEERRAVSFTKERILLVVFGKQNIPSQMRLTENAADATLQLFGFIQRKFACIPRDCDSFDIV